MSEASDSIPGLTLKLQGWGNISGFDVPMISFFFNFKFICLFNHYYFLSVYSLLC